MTRSRYTLATIEADAIEKLMPSPLSKLFLRLRHAGDSAAVDQDVLWTDGQLAERELHRAQAGMVDVQPIDFLDLDNADAYGGRPFANFKVKPDARRLVQRFGVVDAVDLGIRRKDHRGCDNRACQRTHADFVDAGYVHDALLPEQPLEVKHGFETKPLLSLLLGAFAERPVQLLRARTRIPLQLAQQLTEIKALGSAYFSRNSSSDKSISERAMQPDLWKSKHLGRTCYENIRRTCSERGPVRPEARATKGFSPDSRGWAGEKIL